MEVRDSPLKEAHLAAGGALVDFAGWQMPIHYGSCVQEHQAVRAAAGMFDISHMGVLAVTGAGAEESLNLLLTNDLQKLSDGSGQYTLLLNEAGGVIDDLIIYRLSSNRFILVVNASKTQEDIEWLQQNLGSRNRVTLSNRSDELFGLAVQGPAAVEALEKTRWSAGLPGRNGILEDGGCFLCRTGYTGEDGFELFGPVEQAREWWDAFLGAGVLPCGLGARDTLRLEAGFPLNGNDLSPDHSPVEAGLSAFVTFGKDSFVGRQRCVADKATLKRRLMGLKASASGPPLRAHYPVLGPDGGTVAELTSGAVSPSNRRGIGLAYLPLPLATVGTELQVLVRNRAVPVTVVKKSQLKPA